MQHLDSERIAAFDHDAPTAGELAHLEACATCRAERAAFSRLSQRALQLIDAPVPSNMPRLTNWESLSARLRTDGLITTPDTGRDDESQHDYAAVGAATDRIISINARSAHSHPRVRNEWWRMAAAAVMLVAGGAVWGRYSETAKAIGPGSADLPNITSEMPLGLGSTGYGSMEEASKALSRIERDFARTSLWMTVNDPSANSTDVLRRRLAQLDQLTASSKMAWDSAPQDKVLEHYYRSAYSARELTLQQLGSALPVGRSLERF